MLTSNKIPTIRDFSRCYTLKLLAETFVQRRCGQVSQSGVLHGETRVFVTTAIVATVAEVESGSTFGETCLATEVQNVSRNRPCYTVQRLLKHVSQRRCTQVSAKSFNV